MPRYLSTDPNAGTALLPKGQIAAGNIDLMNRPKVPNPNGGTSTVYSASFNIDGKEVLLPLSDEGRILSENEAVAKYKRTGKHLGIFATPAAATAYASQLHKDYEAGKYESGGYLSTDPKAGESDRAKLSAKPAAKAPSNLDRLSSLLPSVGGAVGGIAGGVPGAALGGAAGEGYRQLATHGTELPGALMDVLQNLRSQPGATLKGAVSGVGEGLKNTGIEAAAQGAMEGMGQLATKALGTGARAVYRGYLKPSMAKNAIGKADEVVETALREALPITGAGAKRAQQVITELRQQVDAELKAASGTVDLHRVAERVRGFAKRKYFMPGKPSADFDAAMRVADEIDNHLSNAPIPPRARVDTVDLPTANKIKRGIDESIGESNFGVDRGATKTTQKVGRRELRQAIETQAPNVGPLNAREGELIDAAKAIARAVARESNKSPLIGVNTLASGALGAGTMAYTDNPYATAVAALGSRMLLTPAYMTRAAIVASRLGKMPNAVPANAARIAAAAVKAVLAEQDPSE